MSGSADGILTHNGSGGIVTESNLLFDGTALTNNKDSYLNNVTIKDNGGNTGNIGWGSRLLKDFDSGLSLTAGDVYYWNSSSSWSAADADAVSTAKGLLAVCSSITTDGANMLVEGVVIINSNISTASNGDPLYLSTTAGKVTHVAPTGTGDVVRIVGYVVDNTKSTIYFNPSQDWIELS